MNWWYNTYDQLADDFVSCFYEMLECKNIMQHRIEPIVLQKHKTALCGWINLYIEKL